MRHIIPIFCLFLLACGSAKKEYEVTADPAPILGEWEGAILIQDIELGMIVNFARDGDTLRATMDIPEQGASNLVLEAVQFDGSKVYFELDASIGRAVYDGKLEDEKISGTFKQGMANGTFYLEPLHVIPEDIPYIQEEVSIEVTDDVTLAGTLTLPEGKGPFRAVVLITGSGPQNRDEYVFGFKPFKILADHFTREGIAVLRCDDRGVASSTGDRDSATTKDFADDVKAQVAYLESRPEIGSIGLLGHSEGALVSGMVAAGNPDIGFVVLMAGPAVRGDELLMAQLEEIMRVGGASKAEIAAELELQARTFNVMRTGHGAQELRADMHERMKAQIKELPFEERLVLGNIKKHIEKVLDAKFEAVSTPWFRFFTAYDPRPDLAEVKCRVLAVFGGKDTQVPAEMNSKALEETFTEAGKKNFKIRIFTDANHLFQTAETGSPDEYAKLEKEFVPDFAEFISTWILK